MEKATYEIFMLKLIPTLARSNRSGTILESYCLKYIRGKDPPREIKKPSKRARFIPSLRWVENEAK